MTLEDDVGNQGASVGSWYSRSYLCLPSAMVGSRGGNGGGNGPASVGGKSPTHPSKSDRSSKVGQHPATALAPPLGRKTLLVLLKKSTRSRLQGQHADFSSKWIPAHWGVYRDQSFFSDSTPIGLPAESCDSLTKLSSLLCGSTPEQSSRRSSLTATSQYP